MDVTSLARIAELLSSAMAGVSMVPVELISASTTASSMGSNGLLPIKFSRSDLNRISFSKSALATNSNSAFFSVSNASVMS